MTTEDRTSKPTSSADEMVKFVYHGGGKDHMHETKTHVFLGSIRVLRIGEKHIYTVGPMEMTLPHGTSIEYHCNAIDLMQVDDRVAIAKHILQGLQGHPGLAQMLREAS